MKKVCITALLFSLLFLSAASAQQFFTDRATFLANLKPDFYQENFDDDPLDGHQSFWEAPGANGFGFNVSAPGSGNQQLYSLFSAISTSSYNDPLAFEFSGNVVYAFGGDFWGTQYDGFPQLTEITFETDTGQSFTHEVSNRTFIGFISDAPLTSITISTAGAQAAWPTADGIITGELNPNGDLDGDGMNNSAEQLAGTDPFDSKSNLRTTSVGFDHSDFVVTFKAVAGKTYRLEYKDALTQTDWLPTDVSDYFASTTGPAQLTVSPDFPNRFYRVTLVPP